MQFGIIQSIATDKGFGFIKPDDGSTDVFFHKSTFVGHFDRLRKGAELRYELDTSADKPRASKVVPADTPPDGELNYGHVTRILWKRKVGLISSNAGGTEILFQPETIVRKKLHELEIGEYVQFVLKPDPEDPKQPEASYVIVAEKPRIASVPQLGRHPRSRAKKPNWRNK